MNFFTPAPLINVKKHYIIYIECNRSFGISNVEGLGYIKVKDFSQHSKR